FRVFEPILCRNSNRTNHLHVVDRVLRFLSTCAVKNRVFSRVPGPRRLTPEANFDLSVNLLSSSRHASCDVREAICVASERRESPDGSGAREDWPFCNTSYITY